MARKGCAVLPSDRVLSAPDQNHCAGICRLQIEAKAAEIDRPAMLKIAI